MSSGVRKRNNAGANAEPDAASRRAEVDGSEDAVKGNDAEHNLEYYVGETGRSRVLRSYGCLGALIVVSCVVAAMPETFAWIPGSTWLLVLAVAAADVGACHAVMLRLTQRVLTQSEDEAADDLPDDTAAKSGDTPAGPVTADYDAGVEMMTGKSAMMMPVYGSFFLVAMFVVQKFFPFPWLKGVIVAYMLFMSSASVYQNLSDLANLAGMWPRGEALLGSNTLVTDLSTTQQQVTSDSVTEQPTAPWWHEIVWFFEDASLRDYAFFLVASGCALSYWFSENWIVNNFLGLSFCISGMKAIGLPSFKVGAIMLVGLFVYDIWWVFGSEHVTGHNVMVAVAKGIQAPIKIMQPHYDGEGFNILGLGDIVVPGLFITMLRSFDAETTLSGTSYYSFAMISYTASLITTVTVMLVFQAAQPALLYIVPFLLIGALIQAAVQGQLSDLFAFEDSDEREELEDGDEGEQNKEEHATDE